MIRWESDYSGGHANAKLIGNARVQTGNGKFGNGALYLDGNESWAEVGILKQVLNVTLEESLIGWWKFDEGSGTTATNFVSGESSGTLINSNFSTQKKNLATLPLYLPTNQSSAKVNINPVLNLGGTDRVATFTISAWFRNLYPVGVYRTLSRGETNGNHLIVQNTSNQVGVFAHNNGDWIASDNFNLEPDGLWASNCSCL